MNYGNYFTKKQCKKKKKKKKEKNKKNKKKTLAKQKGLHTITDTH